MRTDGPGELIDWVLYPAAKASGIAAKVAVAKPAIRTILSGWDLSVDLIIKMTLGVGVNLEKL